MAARKERDAPPRKKTPQAPKAAPVDAAVDAQADVSPTELRQLISEAAYFRAKQRGFAPGHELEDWIQAEAEVKRRLSRPGA